MSDIREKLQALRQRSARLQTSAADRRAGLSAASKHVEAFLERLPTLPIYVKGGPRSDAMSAFAPSTDPCSLDDALSIVREHIDGIGHNLGSSRFFAYIPSGGLFESALADLIAAASNRYVGVGAAAPGATRLEETMIRWLAGVIGYPASAEGDLTSGGSMAALSAVVAAREAHGVEGEHVATTAVYLTAQMHHTFRKALHVAGLGNCELREISQDTVHRMDAAALRQAIEADRARGITPWLIAATAGTTDTGAVDPLPELADIAAEFGVWLHVDAAYGGAFALCDEGRARLRGIERSDSVVIDPHKGLFLPGGTGVVLVRDGRALFNAYHARGTYMQDVAGDTERSPCDYSAELTRPFRALRFWLPLKVHGSDVFAAALHEKLLLARYFHDKVRSIPRIECGPAPDLSIVTFRFCPDGDDPDAATRRLLEAINSDGRAFLTSTTIGGRFTIRMAILTYNTHIEDVETALEAIAELTGRLVTQQR